MHYFDLKPSKKTERERKIKEDKVIEAIKFGAHTPEEIQCALGLMFFKKEEIIKILDILVSQKKLWMNQYKRPYRESYSLTKR